jgi:hypothetical protein
MRNRIVTAVAIVAMFAAACGGGPDMAAMTEVQRLRSGPLDVVLLSASGALRHGMDEFVIEFRSATDGSLIDVGEVRASSSMSMAGTPMLGTVNVSRTETAGRYLGSAALSMAGTWRTTIEWDGRAGKGTVAFSSSVR